MPRVLMKKKSATTASVLGALSLSAVFLSACTFNFELTSQRTALENQVMGSYKELEDDLVLVSSVRAPGETAAKISDREKRALDARQDQEFNRDDIDELKSKEIIGETKAGTITILPEHVGHADQVDKATIKLAKQLVEQENTDRSVIWQRIIELNTNLTTKDLPAVRSTYAKMQRDTALIGQWLQTDAGQWQKKAGEAPASEKPGS